MFPSKPITSGLFIMKNPAAACPLGNGVGIFGQKAPGALMKKSDEAHVPACQ